MSRTTTFDAGPIFEHDSDHGFCTVCGAVWPCARVRRRQPAETGVWLT